MYICLDTFKSIPKAATAKLISASVDMLNSLRECTVHIYKCLLEYILCKKEFIEFDIWYLADSHAITSKWR